MGAAVAGWTVAAVLLQVAGLSLFLYGFFPVKPTLRSFSGAESYQVPSCGFVSAGEQEPTLHPDQLRSLYRELSGIPPVYDRLVLMVIDGLPTEFVLGRGRKPPSKEMMESMPYTQSLLAGCKAAPYHAKAAPPTITMPRLKVVVSDHGMTEGGNHGGSSYEETDSFALFIGHSVESPYRSPYDQNEALQVDLAPTLALLLGIPIPKNNFGVVLPELLNSLTDDQKLRMLELNSWQILRLLQAQVPAFCLEDCINSEGSIVLDILHESIEKKLCHLLSKAFSSHQSSRLHRGSDFKSVKAGYYGTAADNYYGFLRYASEWLSHRATDKPFYLLASAILLMTVSCLFLMSTVSCLFKARSLSQVDHHSESYLDQRWHLDEVLVLAGMFLYVISLGSSSFVEEEQYTWHFLTSTLYLIFLTKAVQSMLKGSNPTLGHKAEEKSFDKSNFSYATSFGLTLGVMWGQGYVRRRRNRDVRRDEERANRAGQAVPASNG